MLWYALFLGLLQGLTEFLPVSSSGHLAICNLIFNKFDQPGLLFEILLHTATSIAVIIYLKSEICGMIRSLFIRVKPGPIGQHKTTDRETIDNRRLIGLIIIASIPTAFLGLIFKTFAEEAFRSGMIVSLGFLATASLLFISKYFRRDAKSLYAIGIFDAFIIGIAQGIAVFPGVSRSGITITSALLLGFKPDASARFSFLISLPAIIGATVLDINAIRDVPFKHILPLIAGMIVAGVIGFIAIKTVISIAKSWKLHYFAPYCLILAIILFISSII